MKILMLGNSFIFTNDLPGKIEFLTGAEVTDHSAGGAELKDQLDPSHPLGKKTLAALKEKKWDYVIIQECSNGPVTDKEAFFKNAGKLCSLIREKGAVPVFYATWAYEPDSEIMKNFCVSYEEMNKLLYEAYHEAAEENDAFICDVGKRFEEITAASEDKSVLYAEDGCHPSERGSRTAAAVIAETIYGPSTVTAAEMKQLERAANEWGISYYQMMENAGEAAFSQINERYPGAEEYIVFIGKGNNGGDGLVVARLAAAAGKKVILVTAEGVPVTEDALTNYELLKKKTEENSLITICSIDSCPAFPDKEAVIVDAVFGTGFHGMLRPEGKKVCCMINELSLPVVSLDIPSGMNADTGEADPDAVRADVTTAFQYKKPAHISENAFDLCGTVITCDIGIA